MMGYPQGNMPDLSNAEVVDYTIESGDTRVRLKLKDGSILEVKMEVTGILRVGNDPNTGFPAYMVQSTNIVRLAHCPKELRKAPLKQGQKDSKQPLPGFS
jgi:phosphotransferase system IIB component